jgi:hypothetical protein
MDGDRDKTSTNHVGEQQKLDKKDLEDFGKLMKAVDGKRMQSALRTILQYAFEYNKKLTNFCNSVHLYKIFQVLMVAEGPFSQQWIQK